jgi:hypothetical protein
MRCHICYRQAKGLLFVPERAPRAAWLHFCSCRCQRAWGAIVEQFRRIREAPVIDPTEMEKTAFNAALKPLGECVALLGLQRPPTDWSREDALRLIEVVVDAFQAEMIEQHERMAERYRQHFEQLAAHRSARTAAEAR